MNLNEMKLGDLLKLASCLGKPEKVVDLHQENGPLRIVVLQRGWVAIGYFYQSGERCWLERGATIRIWGTSGKAGLSHLANEGPTKDTVLDKTPRPIRFHELTVVHMYDCDELKWKSHL